MISIQQYLRIDFLTDYLLHETADYAHPSLKKSIGFSSYNIKMISRCQYKIQ